MAPPANDRRVPSVMALPPETINDIVNNHTQELALRVEEIALRKQEDANSFEFAKQQLEAQLKDRNEQRQHDHKMRRQSFVLVGFLALILAVLWWPCRYGMAKMR